VRCRRGRAGRPVHGPSPEHRNIEHQGPQIGAGIWVCFGASLVVVCGVLSTLKLK